MRIGSLARFALAATILAAGTPLVAAPTIVLIGGKKQGMAAGEHDFPNGVIKIERLIKASPEFKALNPVIKMYPVGFPKNLAEIDDASVVVIYTGPTRGTSPSTTAVQDPAVRAQLEKLAAKGVGLVALHQAFTAPDQATAKNMVSWFGGSRAGGSDYSMETAPVTVATKGHPIANGVKDFNFLDEFYSAIDFAGAGVTPVLRANAHVQLTSKGAVYREPPAQRVIAWAFERPGGGRSFTFAAGHYLGFLDQQEARTAVLNGIMWAARENVPASGVTSTLPVAGNGGLAPPPEPQIVVLPIENVKNEKQPWGMLQWFAGRPQGNSSKLTVGQATILPGQQNPVHWHPNCDEVLHVLKGRIMHRVGDKEYEMKEGDTVVIPEGVLHNARNIGTENAVLAVSFNSADRVAIGE